MARRRWTTLTVFVGREDIGLDGHAKLAALVLWLRDEPPSGIVVLDPTGRRIHDPLAVDWCNFPIQDAIDAAYAHGYLVSQLPARCA